MFRLLAGIAAILGMLVVLAFAPDSASRVTASDTAGNPLPPLMSCPNLDASSNNTVTVADILAVVLHFNKHYGEDGYAYLYDPVSPYNDDSPTGTGVITVADILYVVVRYNRVCPLVDTQVALAATWAIANVPMTEDAADLAAIGYYQSSFHVPGQGVHYVKFENWDGSFDPRAPEGLVYDDQGRLSAELYVVNGDNVGWGTHASTSWPPPAVPHEVDLEGDSDGPRCSTTCSWDGGYDGWHMHYYLCGGHIGTPSAFALPGFQTEADCAGASGGEPECTVPVSVTPCYRWGQNVGWMGHLWSFLPNANLIPDVNDTQNGRFADCYPDGSGWKAFNCPA